MSAANTNTELFEKTPIPIACGKLIIPTVIGSLVAVLYSMADTYFVGALNSDVQSAAVSVAAPALLLSLIHISEPTRLL